MPYNTAPVEEKQGVPTRYIVFIVSGVIVFGLVMLVLWRGTHGSGFGKDIAGAEKAEGVFSNATIAPNQASVIKGDCSCPTVPGMIMAGQVASHSVMGQSKHEGNSPYLFANCEGDAKQMLLMLQDEEIFGYAKSMTRADLGSYPPRQLFFTWDQEAGMCHFFLDCNGMTACTKSNVATGLVVS